jgi:hypothetical protein
LSSGRRLRAVAGTLEELEESASNFGQDYLYVTVKTTGPVPGIADRIREILPNALDVRTDYPRTATKLDEERKQMAPDALFAAFYESQHGAPATKELLLAFNSLHEEVMDATD